MNKTVFVVIEMADVELLSVEVFDNLDNAQTHFDKCAEENRAILNDCLVEEIEGTLAFAGDHAYSVQLIQK